MIAPYVEKDPTAFCSYEDHRLAADTLEQVCMLRAESVRKQLDGEIPATIRGQQEAPQARLMPPTSVWKIWETFRIWKMRK